MTKAELIAMKELELDLIDSNIHTLVIYLEQHSKHISRDQLRIHNKALKKLRSEKKKHAAELEKLRQ